MVPGEGPPPERQGTVPRGVEGAVPRGRVSRHRRHPGARLRRHLQGEGIAPRPGEARDRRRRAVGGGDGNGNGDGDVNESHRGPQVGRLQDQALPALATLRHLPQPPHASGRLLLPPELRRALPVRRQGALAPVVPEPLQQRGYGHGRPPPQDVPQADLRAHCRGPRRVGRRRQAPRSRRQVHPSPNAGRLRLPERRVEAGQREQLRGRFVGGVDGSGIPAGEFQPSSILQRLIGRRVEVDGAACDCTTCRTTTNTDT